MKIDPNNEATLPPLGECVVLYTAHERLLGGRDAINQDEWLWAEQYMSPHWDDAKERWELDGDFAPFDVPPVSWHPIGGEA